MDNNKAKHISFFKKIQDFCYNLEKEVASIKKKSDTTTGTHHQNYVKAIGTINSEIKDLKRKSEEIKAQIGEVYQFENFAQYVQELVKEQSKDVDTMEEYLEKFGYKPPNDLKYLPKIEPEIVLPHRETNYPDFCGEDPDSGQQHNRSSIDYIQTIPELREMEGDYNPLDMKTPSRKQKMPWYATPTSAISSHSKVKMWISQIDTKYTHGATPYSVNKKIVSKIPQKENVTSTPEEPSLSELGRVAISLSRPNSDSRSKSIEEPQLSQFTVDVIETKMLKRISSHTPDDPSLTEYGQAVVDGLTATPATKFHTPEEPELYIKQMKDVYLDELPPSPQLSDVTLRILNR